MKEMASFEPCKVRMEIFRNLLRQQRNLKASASSGFFHVQLYAKRVFKLSHYHLFAKA